MLLTTLLVPVPMVRRTAPTMPRTMLKVDADMDARFFRCVDAVGVDAGSSPGSGTGLGADVGADAVSVGVSASMWAGVCGGRGAWGVCVCGVRQWRLWLVAWEPLAP